jgi:hypothetical protein
MPSSHLKAERQRLLDRIAQIRDSGQVAPAYAFLSETSTTSRSGKTYHYARLIQQRRGEDKQTVRSLGQIGSENHRRWQKAIARREAIVELEMQLSLLTTLIDRQNANRNVVNQDFSEPN